MKPPVRPRPAPPRPAPQPQAQPQVQQAAPAQTRPVATAPRPAPRPGNALVRRTQGGVKPQRSPAPKTPLDPKQMEAFKLEFEAIQPELEALVLPAGMPIKLFAQTLFTAIARDPSLLSCDRMSLLNAAREAATQRLLPDGRQGVIFPYLNEKTGILFARWHVMIEGMRIAAARSNVFIQAAIVQENDHFDWREGYDPWIDHVPAQLGTVRGRWVGVYAIFRRSGERGEVISHCVMDVHQIEAVKGVVKAQTGLLWTKFEDQAWIKSVIRRGIKSVPVLSPDAMDVVSNDDRYVDWERAESAADEATEGTKTERVYNPLEDPTEDEVRGTIDGEAHQIDDQGGEA